GFFSALLGSDSTAEGVGVRGSIVRLCCTGVQAASTIGSATESTHEWVELYDD
ncbi:unnamed protein product, partial [Musa acuminata subsp. burmannicoides]